MLFRSGAVAANGVALHLVNLAGNQVEIAAEAQTIEQIEPGESQVAYFSVQGGKTLYTQDLAFGVYAESPDLKNVVRQRYVIKGHPNGSMSPLSSNAQPGQKPVKFTSH